MNLPKSYPTCSLVMAKAIAGIAAAINSSNSPGEPCEHIYYREGIAYFLSDIATEGDLERLKLTLESAIEFLKGK